MRIGKFLANVAAVLLLLAIPPVLLGALADVAGDGLAEAATSLLLVVQVCLAVSGSLWWAGARGIRRLLGGSVLALSLSVVVILVLGNAFYALVPGIGDSSGYGFEALVFGTLQYAVTAALIVGSAWFVEGLLGRRARLSDT